MIFLNGENHHKSFQLIINTIYFLFLSLSFSLLLKMQFAAFGDCDSNNFNISLFCDRVIMIPM